jgi:hypothetical protein
VEELGRNKYPTTAVPKRTCLNASMTPTSMDVTTLHRNDVVHADHVDHADADPRNANDIIALLMYLIG